MKIEDREQVLSIVQQLMEDNANNRITLSLAQGIIATARGLLNAEPPARPPLADPAVTQGAAQ